MNMLGKVFIRFFLAMAVLSYATAAMAAGYEIMGHSAEGTGVSYAGAVTGYGDGSSAHYNPAAMAVVDGAVVHVGGHAVPMRYKFQDKGSTVLGMPAASSASGSATVTGWLPYVYGVAPLTEQWNIGLQLTSPWGLSTEFKDGWVGRYQNLKAELNTLKVGGALSYKVTEQLSFGAGLSGLYGEVDLKNAVDFGTIGVSLLGFDTASQLGLLPQMNDGEARLKGDDWAFSWNLGALYRYGDHDRNRVGLMYRPRTEFDLRGNASFKVPAEARLLSSGGAFTNTKAQATLPLPETVAVGATHWVHDQVALLWESAWTKWSRFYDIVIDYDNPAQPAAVDIHNWRDTWRHALGLKYVPNEKWTLRTGFMYDQSPIRGAEFRGPLLPTSDQYFVSAGLTYSFTEMLRGTFGYTHGFMDSASSNKAGVSGDQFVGKWENSFDIFSLALAWDF